MAFVINIYERNEKRLKLLLKAFNKKSVINVNGAASCSPLHLSLYDV